VTWNVWAAMPQYVNGRRPWSLVASAVSDDDAQTYRRTFHFPLHIEATDGTGPRQSPPGEDTSS
jgi:hypothetical protein